MNKMKKSVIVALLAALCVAAWAASQEELLIQAVKNHDIPTLRILIRQWANLDYTYEDGKSALMYACKDSWYEGVVFLLGENANVELTDRYGRTALMYAVQSGYIMSVRLLINNGANINVSDYEGKTALMYAIENQVNDIVDLLLRQGADCFAKDSYGNTVAMYAVKYQNLMALDKLLERSPFVDWNQTNGEGISPFTAACMRGDLYAIKQLLEKVPVNISDSRIDGMPIIIWLIANRKAPAIIKCIMEYCNQEEILSMTDHEGHDIKYWAEKQGYENILMRLYDYEIEKKESRQKGAYSKSIRRNF